MYIYILISKYTCIRTYLYINTHIHNYEYICKYEFSKNVPEVGEFHLEIAKISSTCLGEFQSAYNFLLLSMYKALTDASISMHV